MTRHRRALTGPQAAVWSFGITAGTALGIACVVVSPAAFIALCIVVLFVIGFR